MFNRRVEFPNTTIEQATKQGTVTEIRRYSEWFAFDSGQQARAIFDNGTGTLETMMPSQVCSPKSMPEEVIETSEFDSPQQIADTLGININASAMYTRFRVLKTMAKKKPAAWKRWLAVQCKRRFGNNAVFAG